MLTYAIKSAITLTLLYVPYLLMLGKEKQPGFNRRVLILIMISSVVLPLCDITALLPHGISVLQSARTLAARAGIPVGAAVTVTPGDAATGSLPWASAAACAYIGVGVVLAAGRVRGLVHLMRAVRGNRLWQRTLDGDITLYCLDGDVPPFSLGRSIVIGQRDYEENGTEIVMHERGHIVRGHSSDTALLCLCQLVQWFNPLVWKMGRSLADVHEYEADDYVLSHGIDAAQYQMLIIRKAVGSSSYTFANNFNHSLIKKRITMMCKKQSNPWMRAKALYVIPVAAATLCAFATPKSQTPTAGPTAATAASPTPTARMDAGREMPEVLPVFPGGEAALMKFMIENLRYPAEAQENAVQGRMMVTLAVDRDGKASVKSTRFVDHADGTKITANAYKPDGAESEGTSAARRAVGKDGTSPLVRKKAIEALEQEARRVVAKMPRWTPGTSDGKAVECEYVLPISFRLQ